MDNKRLVNGGVTKKQLREEKRQLKQIGNQQKRTREKAALRDLLDGDIDAIPDFEYDRPSQDWNGLDRRVLENEKYKMENGFYDTGENDGVISQG